LADTLITPMNDSFVDFDLLARIDPTTGKILGPSIYAEMVWAARQTRARRRAEAHRLDRAAQPPWQLSRCTTSARSVRA
jgi:hypothetical protein